MAEKGPLAEEGKLFGINDQECRTLLINITESENNIRSKCLSIHSSSLKIHDWLHLHRKNMKTPYELMRNALEEQSRSRNSWSDDLASDIPKSWVKHGEMILFDSKSFVHPIWKLEEKLGRKFAIQPDGYRTPKVEMLYSWDVMKCMFSPGNATERHRISQMDCEGETIVDLYAGIGYFTLPFLLHANASFVHACEWNSDAIEALRVVMGLIPSCEQGIIPACKALKSCTGGILHMHENVSSFTKHSKNKRPLVSPFFSYESLKLVREFCEDCASIIITFPGSGMPIKKNIENVSEQLVPNGCSINLDWQGTYCKPVWDTTSPIFWKRKEWFIQAVHFSHKVCAFISNYHQISWKVEVLGYHHVKSYAPHIDHI
ncbi:hypothetical protein J437_LFUL003701, partial [Ladona fulva]